MDVSEEIERIGLDEVAQVLGITQKELKCKIDRPSLFTIRDLDVLMRRLRFTDKMILLTLERIKREE